jgi:pre-mRNA-splicing factor SYF1
MLRTGINIQFEEDITRNPFYLKIWWNYITSMKDGSALDRFLIYERALKFLPRSYKLWHAYLIERTDKASDKCINSKQYQILINTYERALISMNKMPKIW